MRVLPGLGWAALACVVLAAPASRGEGAPRRGTPTSKPTSGATKPGSPRSAARPRAAPKRGQGPGATSRRRGAGRPAPTNKPPEFPPDADSSWASTVARMDRHACHAELERRGVPVTVPGSGEDTRGVAIPVRLAGPLGGVSFRTDYPDAQRPTLPFEVFDCRLVLALSAFASILREHGVTEVRMFSAYRPPSRRTPADAVLTGHPGALAVDLRTFLRESSTGQREELDVLRDFHGRIGEIPCAPGVTAALTGRARDLRAIYCEGARARLFHLMLSPDGDRPHRNHFHVEVRPEVPWFIVR